MPRDVTKTTDLVFDWAVSGDVSLSDSGQSLKSGHRVLQGRDDTATHVDGPRVVIGARTDRLDTSIDERERH